MKSEFSLKYYIMQIVLGKTGQLQWNLSFSSSLRPGFEGCSQIMNDSLYLRFVCLEQDEIFSEHKTQCFLLP